MRIVRLAGVDVRINEWLIVLAALYVWAGVAVEVALAFACVAWHELGHVLVARRKGFDVQEVEFFPFGGVARLEPGLEQSPGDEIPVVLAGPIFSFLLLLLLEGGMRLGVDWGDYLDFLRNVNFSIGLFNLLPILPLDGGRLCRAWLAGRWGVMGASLRTASWGEALALIFGLLAIVGLYGGRNGLDLPLIAGFLFLGAHKERSNGPMFFWNLFRMKRRKLAVRVAWNGEVVVARRDVRISSLLPRIVPDRCLLVTVVDENGAIIGQISENELLQQMLQGKEDPAVGELIRRGG
ncbi:peptidase family m50 [Heliomicrobium modesticaldum Ice1]|uniref:Peptidase family m50 n=1 Tax=Heliobacterium modesticaldum (strain ATCC 51547 / Ice1) TaxID=498761 RepID=B0TBX1_HELMI|nr:M50 family metallopeptidase [Heliomicrobium modesticaldum]ABZ85244.1 peptidase family m50 [Heliomicrobium modesticaldum Ice1]